jgi:hypothetical protein
MAIIPVADRASSSYFPNSMPNKAGSIYIASLRDNEMSNIDNSILSVNVDYSMNEASQLSFEVIETVTTNFSTIFNSEKTHPNRLEYSFNNYFQIGRDVVYQTPTRIPFPDQGNPGSFTPVLQSQVFEISALTVSQGSGGSPVWQVTCFPKGIQQMKRDRNFKSIKGSGTAFVKRAAQKYGLRFWGQETNKKISITKASGDNQADSLWDVIKRLASDSKFVVYEVDGVIVFASEDYLMYRWGIDNGGKVQIKNSITKRNETRNAKFIPLQFPGVSFGTPGIFQAMQYPTIRISDNDPRYGDGSIVVDRQNGTQIRPGMTAYIGDIPGLNGYYLVESVSFSDRTPDPVTVSFRKPTKEPKDIKDLQIGERFFATSSLAPIGTIVSRKTSTSVASDPLPGEILPLPNASQQNRYPKISSVTSYGNIPMYSRPILNTSSGVQTVGPISFFQKPDLSIRVGNFQTGDTVVVVPTIWTVGGQPAQITKQEAIDKYLSDGLFVAKLSSPDSVNRFINLLNRQQYEVVKNRYRYVNTSKGQSYPNVAGST